MSQSSVWEELYGTVGTNSTDFGITYLPRMSDSMRIIVNLGNLREEVVISRHDGSQVAHDLTQYEIERAKQRLLKRESRLGGIGRDPRITDEIDFYNSPNGPLVVSGSPSHAGFLHGGAGNPCLVGGLPNG